MVSLSVKGPGTQECRHRGESKVVWYPGFPVVYKPLLFFKQLQMPVKAVFYLTKLSVVHTISNTQLMEGRKYAGSEKFRLHFSPNKSWFVGSAEPDHGLNLHYNESAR